MSFLIFQVNQTGTLEAHSFLVKVVWLSVSASFKTPHHVIYTNNINEETHSDLDSDRGTQESQAFPYVVRISKIALDSLPHNEATLPVEQD